MPNVATRRKRRVGQLLRSLREAAGITADDVAEELGRSRPTVTRAEQGLTLLQRAEVLALARMFGASDAQRAELLALWEDARHDTTRVRVPAVSPRQLRSFLRAEAEASEELSLSPIAIEGLLQTAEYARAVNLTPSGFRPAPVDVTRIVEARLSRQQRLYGPNPLTVCALLDEAVIKRVVGGPAVMREQLLHLITLSELPNVTIQVVPFAAGEYGTMSGSVTVLKFHGEDDPPAAYLEYPAGGVWIEDDEDVSRLIETFEASRDLALSPSETVDLIREQIDRLGERSAD